MASGSRCGAVTYQPVEGHDSNKCHVGAGREMLRQIATPPGFVPTKRAIGNPVCYQCTICGKGWAEIQVHASYGKRQRRWFHIKKELVNHDSLEVELPSERRPGTVSEF